MQPKALEIIKEALAVIGVGLFVFGVWQINHSVACMVAGAMLTLPFIRSGRG